MDLLLDTHTFLWIAAQSPELSPRACELYLDEGNRAHLSLASVWEMAIKSSIGKLTLSVPLEHLVREAVEAQGIRLLPIKLEDVLAVESLPFHHRDPFDRLLVAQAVSGELTILSRDTALDAYPVSRQW